MATMTKGQAVDRLTHAIKKGNSYDLVEIYNELFPEKPTTEDEAIADPSGILNKVIAHIELGLEDQEVLDLLHVVFPLYREVWFDEEEGLVHYTEKLDRVYYAD